MLVREPGKKQPWRTPAATPFAVRVSIGKISDSHRLIGLRLKLL